MRVLLRVVVAWIAFIAAQMAGGMLLPVHLPIAPHTLPWLFAADLLTVAGLAWVASHSGWSRNMVIPALFAIGFAITLVNGVEASFFLLVPGISWTKVVVGQMFGLLVLAGVVAMLFATPKSEVKAHENWLSGRSFGAAIGTFLACDALYLILYFVAGMIVVPYVRDWYATQHIPSFRTIITLQLLLRGPIFVLLCILLTHMLRVRGLAQAMMVGLVFTTLSGVTQLMVPSALFPDAVRWAHFCEVSSSNFVFGLLVAMLWKHRAPEMIPQTVAAAV